MALANYSDLLTAIANWARHGSVTPIVADIVTLAETRLSRALRCPPQEALAEGTTLDGAITVPDDFVEGRQVIIVVGGYDLSLRVTSLSNYSDLVATGSDAQCAIYFGDSYKLAPAPTDDTAYKLYYFAKLPPLETNTTNWLMTKYPDAYLFASMCEVANFLRNDSDLQKWESRLSGVLSDIRTVEDRARFSGSGLVMSAR